MRHISITALLMLLGQPSQVAGADSFQGKVAVMALVAEQDPGMSARMAKIVFEKLNDRVNLLPVEQVVLIFGGIGKPEEDMERLRGLFQQGYLQSYSFEYPAAIKNLKQVLVGLEKVVEGPGRWELFVRAHIFLGKAYMGNKQRKAAVRAFQRVLSARPGYLLDPKEYSPRDIKLWKVAKRELAARPLGKLTVDTGKAGAKVFMDGAQVGKTPYIGTFPHGQYHLKVEDSIGKSVSCWVNISDKPVIKRYQMEFETAIDLSLDHPVIRIPRGYDSLPTHWWPWLGVKLGVERLAVVSEKLVDKRSCWVASLVDVERSRIIRQGWLESSGLDLDHMAADAVDLANFLITGKETKRVVRVHQAAQKPNAEKARPTESGIRLHPSKTDARMQALEVKTFSSRPLSQTWWPYAACGAVLVGAGVVANIGYSNQSTQTQGDQDKANLLLGASIAGYAVGAGLIVLGAILHHGYTNTHEEPKTALIPYANPAGGGLQVFGRF